MRPKASSAPRGDVMDGRRAGLFALTGPSPFLVDGARCDLRSKPFRIAALLETILDVFVLAFALGVPRFLGHRNPPSCIRSQAGPLTVSVARPAINRVPAPWVPKRLAQSPSNFVHVAALQHAFPVDFA